MRSRQPFCVCIAICKHIDYHSEFTVVFSWCSTHTWEHVSVGCHLVHQTWCARCQPTLACPLEWGGLGSSGWRRPRSHLEIVEYLAAENNNGCWTHLSAPGTAEKLHTGHLWVCRQPSCVCIAIRKYIDYHSEFTVVFNSHSEFIVCREIVV